MRIKVETSNGRVIEKEVDSWMTPYPDGLKGFDIEGDLVLHVLPGHLVSFELIAEGETK